MPTEITSAKDLALLVVDAQPTFMPGGELPVPHGDNILDPILSFIESYGEDAGLIIFSRDWHSPTHFSFADKPTFADGSWPRHGVAGTDNANVHPALTALCKELGIPYIIISKGMDDAVEAYSAFDGFDLDHEHLTLDEQLRAHDIGGVIICGLAGEVCVRATALAALDAGYGVELLLDGIGFLGDSAPTLTELHARGANDTSY
jgi:nicotinamidase/pyrazinamidase